MSVAAPHLAALPRAKPRERLLTPYVILVAGTAVAVLVIAGVGAMAERPAVAGALLVAFLLLQRVEGDLFDGGHVVATSIPILVLALLFGPGAPVLAEGLGLLVLLAGRDRPPMKLVFDFGSLGLAGAAAGAVALLLPAAGPALALTGLAAAVAYVLVNHSLLMLVWALDHGRSFLAIVRERFGTGEVYEIVYGPVAGLLVFGGQRMGPAVIALVGLPLAGMWLGQKASTERALASVRNLEAVNDRLRLMMLQTVESLARTIEARDPHTGGHTERVGDFALSIARRLPFGDDELRALAAGAVIHDVGKIGIPDAILLKQGPLDEEEWAWMRRHPEIGAYILGGLDIPELAKHVARHHHERYDGGGYPDGLAGEQIPLAARVLTVADALDAMTSDRPYRRALPVETALAELRAKAGSQFCPTVVDALLAAHEAGELGLTSGGTP